VDGHVIWVGYTTHYREGSDKFARAASTLERELARRHPEHVTLLEPLRTKADFVAAMQRLVDAGQCVAELHFIGHSGMYGIMFGSKKWPEQLSPHEWRALRIPFAAGASAHFHACRSARWFAPFFARTFGVRAFGHQGYTTVSTRPDRFSFEGLRLGRGGPLYLISVPGRKTHGLFGALLKYALSPRAIPMRACEPERASNTGYDAVAEHYDRAFTDIRVRDDEWRWLCEKLDAAFPRPERAPRMLDLGCGNGALLQALSGRIELGVGVDVSNAMIERARSRVTDPALRFETISGPHLPFSDGSFDLVTSFLSFRYLDWDPVLSEIRRVLRPGGRLLIVDMVEKPLGWADARLAVRSFVNQELRRRREQRFQRDLRALTTHAAWRRMLEHNPIRADHEYRWYLESRFPGRRVETLNVSRRARLVAFDSGALEPEIPLPMSFP
jgi:ubiquinone/menaquinone biosynthesis C-methylase UbiE